MTGERSTVLSIRDLHKTFTLHAIDGRTVEALRGVDLEVRRGEHVALAGTSGSGKSTLLKCIHRTCLPTAGSIRLDVDGTNGPLELARAGDREMVAVRATSLGYISQFHRAEPRRTVLDTVIRAGVARGLEPTDASERAAATLRRVRLDDQLWGTHAVLLSGGERQRVNLAAGIVAAPPLLLLDEPISALDPDNRKAVLDLIAELTDGDTTVVSVFHDLEAIVALAHRVVVLAAGRVADEGDPRTVLTRDLVET